MGTYTDVYAATTRELEDAFGWMVPAAYEDQGPRRVRDPFTGKTTTVTGPALVAKKPKGWVERDPSASERAKMEALPHALWKGVTFWELSGLAALLVGEGDWLDAFRVVRMQSKEGSQLYALPEALEQALASLPKGEVAARATEWIATDEGEALSEEDAKSVLETLVALASAARKKKRRLYLQM